MARWSRIDRCIWGDAKFRALSPAPPNGQTLFLRLLIAPELGPIPGLFSAWEAGLAQALGWSLKPFRERFAELLREGLAKADWDAGLVWVPNAIKRNLPPNPNVVRGWRGTWAILPECALKDEAYWHLKRYVEPLGERFAEAFRNGLGNRSGNGMPIQEKEIEQEKDQEQDTPPTPPAGGEQPSADDVAEVWQHFLSARRRAVGKANEPKLTDSHRRKLKARLRNYSVGQLKQAIDVLFARGSFWVEHGRTAPIYLHRSDDQVDKLLGKAVANGPQRQRLKNPPSEADLGQGHPGRRATLEEQAAAVEAERAPVPVDQLNKLFGAATRKPRQVVFPDGPSDNESQQVALPMKHCDTCGKDGHTAEEHEAYDREMQEASDESCGDHDWHIGPKGEVVKEG
jgi:hypothetical protein